MKFLISIILFVLSVNTAKSQLQGQAIVDSMLTELDKMQEDTNKVNLLLKLNSLFRTNGEMEKSIEYNLRGLYLSRKIRWSNGEINAHRALGNNYSVQSNYSLAIEHFQNSLRIAEESGNKRAIATSYGDIGFTYLLSTNYEKAIQYYSKALELAEKFDVELVFSNIYGNLSMAYYYLSELDTALYYAKESLIFAEKQNTKREIGVSHNYLGTVYTDLAEYPLALQHFEKGLQIAEEIGDVRTRSISIGFMGRLHYILTQDSIIARIKKQENNIDLNKNNNFKKSLNYIQQTVQIAKHIQDFFILTQCYEYLRLVYRDMGDFEKAYEYQEKWYNLKDSAYSLEKQKEIANLEAKRENEIKDAEIKILQTEKKAQQFQSYLPGGGVIVLLGAFGIAFLRFKEKKKLSDKLANQNNEIETQKSIVDEKNEQIVASITYASTIQHAILPWDSVLESAFNDIFIIYTPKDIVSGDSYWFQEIDGIKFLAVIDCTGHGIPGSMLTVIASSVLDDAVLSKRLIDTGEILSYMNNKVTEVLNQRLAENQIRDGMELALIAIKDNKIQFSGAGRPLYLKSGTFEIIKTDKRGIAGQTENDDYQFSAIEIEKSENLLLYLTTDGFADQMNEESKKYSTKRFVSLLESISNKPMEEQNQILEYEFNSHKGRRSQIDDVTILGVRI